MSKKDSEQEMIYLSYLQEYFKPVAHRTASVEVSDEEGVLVCLPSCWGSPGI